MGMVFTGLSVSVDDFITGRDPRPSMGWAMAVCSSIGAVAPPTPTTSKAWSNESGRW